MITYTDIQYLHYPLLDRKFLHITVIILFLDIRLAPAVMNLKEHQTKNNLHVVNCHIPIKTMNDFELQIEKCGVSPLIILHTIDSPENWYINIQKLGVHYIANSTNLSMQCIKNVNTMTFKYQHIMSTQCIEMSTKLCIDILISSCLQF